MANRRLPVYLVLDVSGSMTGEPIAALNNGLDLMVSTLRQEPEALETAHLSVITFDDQARQLVPLTDLSTFIAPQLTAGGTTSFVEALRVTRESIEREVLKNVPGVKGDWKPIIFFMTDGRPNSSEDWATAFQDFKNAKLGNVIACAAGPDADGRILKDLTQDVVELSSTDPATIKQFFKWVTQSVSVKSEAVDANPRDNDSALSQLPPPPPVINLV
jgi:uncharacterized protein YegL